MCGHVFHESCAEDNETGAICSICAPEMNDMIAQFKEKAKDA